MDHDRANRVVRHPLAKLVDVGALVIGGPPHPRRLVEDLDRVAPEFDASLVRLGEAAGGRDVTADQHSWAEGGVIAGLALYCRRPGGRPESLKISREGAD